MKIISTLTLVFMFIPPLAFSAKVVTSTEHFDIHYDDQVFSGEQGEAFISHLRQMSEDSYHALSEKTGITLKQKVAVTVVNQFDDFNAWATPYLDLQIRLFATSPLFNLFHENGDRWKDVFSHELTHILQMTHTQGISDSLINNLGNNPVFMPNTIVPLFFMEGFAQHLENDFDFNSGRGHRNNPWYEAMWLAEYQYGFEAFSEIAQAQTRRDRRLGYLYGAYFFAYLDETFTQSKITEFFDRRADAFSHKFGFDYLYLNGAWFDVFGEDLTQTWANFIAFESKRLAQVSKIEPLTIESGNTAQLLNFYIDENNFITSAGNGLSAVKINNGKTHILKGHRPESINSRSNGDLVFTQGESCAGQSFNSLYLSMNGQVVEILPCSRIRYAVLHPHKNIIATLRQGAAEQFVELYEFDDKGRLLKLSESDERLKLDAGSWKQEITSENKYARLIDQANYTQSFSDLVFSPDGSKLLINKKDNGYWNLKVIDLENGEQQQITDDHQIRLFVQWLDNDTLIYSKQVENKLQVFSGNLASSFELQASSLISEHQFTNDPLNAYRAFVRGDELFYLSQKAAGEGYAIKKISLSLKQEAGSVKPKKDNDLEKSKASSVKLQASSRSKFTKRPYRVLDTLGIDMVLPTLLLSNNNLRLGAMVLGQDIWQQHQYDLSLASDLIDGQTRLALNYNYKGVLQLSTALADYSEPNTADAGVSNKEGIMSGVSLGTQLPIQMTNSKLLFTMKSDLQRFSLFDDSKVKVKDRFSLNAQYSRLKKYSKAMAEQGVALALQADFETQEHDYQPHGLFLMSEAAYQKTYQASSYLSFPVFRQDYFTLSTAINYSTSSFRVNAATENELYSALINKNLKLHGLNEEAQLSNKTFQVMLDYHIPLIQPSATIGSSLIGIERFVLSPSISMLGDWSFDQIETDLENSKASAAIELQSDISGGFNLPVSFNVGFAKMITDVHGKYPDEVYFKLESRL